MLGSHTRLRSFFDKSLGRIERYVLAYAGELAVLVKPTAFSTYTMLGLASYR